MAEPRSASTPVVLVILDGWGIGRDEPGNAVLAANTPTMDHLAATYPATTLRCSGEDVGLPASQMGNSEVGHLNLGAGFVVYQWITRIDRAIADGSFFANPQLVATMERVRDAGTALHLLGLASNGGVHSHVRHLVALLQLARQTGLERVYVHTFTDGRDTSPTAGLATIEALEQTMADLGVGRIATVSGRYYAMDRDRRWDRVARAYAAIVDGIGATATAAVDAIQRSYDAGTTDEFIEPTVITTDNVPIAKVLPGDAVVYFNFRADRARQLTQALLLPDFVGFSRPTYLPNLAMVTLTSYEDGLPALVAFESQDVANPVARAISAAGSAQLHVAETEKYAHVTFFFNGGREDPFPLEDRVLVPSPKVATYDLQPAMSADGVTTAVRDGLAGGRYAFVIVNYANCDMVGHTGVLPAAVAAVETVDACLGRILDAIVAANGVALVTADHGNAEEMIDRATGRPMTAHTTNPVPFVLVAPDGHRLRHASLRGDGILAAVAPTVLEILGIAPPSEMTESSLIVRH